MRVGGLGVLVVSGGIALVAVRVISSPLVLDRGGVGVLVNGGALAGTGLHSGYDGGRGNGSDGAVAVTATTVAGTATTVAGTATRRAAVGVERLSFYFLSLILVFFLILFQEMGC